MVFDLKIRPFTDALGKIYRNFTIKNFFKKLTHLKAFSENLVIIILQVDDINFKLNFGSNP